MSGKFGEDQDTGGRRHPSLLKELLERRDLDQAARSAIDGRQAFARVMQIDDDNAAWLRMIVVTVGWPGRALVGDEGAHAAWLLAQHADRHPSLQRRCLELLEIAVAAGDASPTDLAYLTDRVRLASGGSQIYGTQMTAQDGKFVARRLRDPESVDDRRTSVGLGTLAAQLDEALARYGAPTPAPMLCPNCRQQISVWLPEIGGRLTIECPLCHSVIIVRADVPEPQSSAGSSRISNPQRS
jgi:hypothetical protein